MLQRNVKAWFSPNSFEEGHQYHPSRVCSLDNHLRNQKGAIYTTCSYESKQPTGLNKHRSMGPTFVDTFVVEGKTSLGRYFPFLFTMNLVGLDKSLPSCPFLAFLDHAPQYHIGASQLYGHDSKITSRWSRRV